MNERQWDDATSPEPMLTFLYQSLPSRVLKRKLRLLLCACCRDVWELMTCPGSWQLVEVAERLADGQASPEERDAAVRVAEKVVRDRVLAGWGAASGMATFTGVRARGLRQAADQVVSALSGIRVSLAFPSDYSPELAARWRARRREERARLCELVRDVFGDPFRPVMAPPEWVEGNGGLVREVAHAIYQEHRFAELPVLADALEEAGCDNSDLLAHCRGPGPHARGCWAVDLVLGKS
jgi:hypothetical protein